MLTQIMQHSLGVELGHATNLFKSNTHHVELLAQANLLIVITIFVLSFVLSLNSYTCWKHCCVFAGMTVVQQGEACQTEEVADEYKGLIWSLVKQVRPGMDLSKVALPTFILEPRSFLDKLSDYYYHIDFLSEWVFWFVFQDVWDYHYYKTWSPKPLHYSLFMCI